MAPSLLAFAMPSILPRLLSLTVLCAALAACATPPGPDTTTTTATTPASTAVAARNKQNARDFYEAFFNRHDLSAADRYIGDTYIQHNPRVANGRQAFVQTFTQLFARFPQRHSTIHEVIAEGDLVALHVHTVTGPDDRGMAIVDIFRFDAQGKIVEHWDVMQPVPDTTASGNGMF